MPFVGNIQPIPDLKAVLWDSRQVYPYDLEESCVLEVADIDVLTLSRIKGILISLTHR